MHSSCYDYLNQHFYCIDCEKPVVTEPSNKELNGLSFTLKWSSMSHNPLLEHYNILYTNRSLLDVAKRQATDQVYKIDGISRDATEYTVTGLTSYSTYCFWLQAVYRQSGVAIANEDSDMTCGITTPPAGKQLRIIIILIWLLQIWYYLNAALHSHER